MATRKDIRGRVLKPGEYQRKDGRYQYSYTDRIGVRRYMYANELATLREKEKAKQLDELTGIDTYLARTVTLNQLFDKHLSIKVGLKNSTRASYIQMYNRYVRDDIIVKNPAKGVLGNLKRANGYSPKKRHALTIDEQRNYMNTKRSCPMKI